MKTGLYEDDYGIGDWINFDRRGTYRFYSEKDSGSVLYVVRNFEGIDSFDDKAD